MGKSRGSRSGKRPTKRPKPPNRHTLGSLQRQMNVQAATEKKEEEPERPTSASERKLTDKDATVDPEREKWSGFRIIDIDRVFGVLLEHLSCQNCRKKCTIEEVATSGFSSKFRLACEKCGVLKVFRNSDLVEQKAPDDKLSTEVNRRMLYASQVMGVKHAGLQTLCAMLDMPPPNSPKTYNKRIEKIHSAVHHEAEKSMLKSIDEEVEQEQSRELCVSGDGTWQRKGFKSKNGVVTLIGSKTGKVVDVEVMTTVCFGCSSYKGPKTGEEYEEWVSSHKPACSINHEGSSGMMEVTGMKRIFERSVARADVKFTRYIGDGDSKTFANIVKSQPYGETVITKIECTRHVQKRMSTRLRKMKKELRGKKLEDGKTIGGQGRLTDKAIDKFASLYGNIIRSYTNVADMKNSIWAMFYHYSSSDSDPQHSLCPTGSNSWCKFNVAVEEGTEKEFIHKSSLPNAVMKCVKPVFEELSNDDLLERCVGGYTQNPNESLNNLIWKNVPKNIFCGLSVLRVGVLNAVLVFNDGMRSHLRVFHTLGITPGKHLVHFCNVCDRDRVSKATKRWSDASKEARKERRRSEKLSNENLSTKEGEVYKGGAF